MASGIISVGLELEGFHALSMALLVVCALSYLLILVPSLFRLARFAADMRSDFMDPGRAFGFFTFIAGTNAAGDAPWHGGMAGRDGGAARGRGARLGGARLRRAVDAGIGARTVEMAGAPMVDATRGLVAGASVVFWSFASWLFPVLPAAGWWRHVLHRVPLSYEPGLWSVIFPLGMYAVAGIYLGRADQLPLVAAIGRAELWLAVAACRVSLPAGRDRGPSAGRRGGQGRRRP